MPHDSLHCFTNAPDLRYLPQYCHIIWTHGTELQNIILPSSPLPCAPDDAQFNPVLHHSMQVSHFKPALLVSLLRPPIPPCSVPHAPMVSRATSAVAVAAANSLIGLAAFGPKRDAWVIHGPSSLLTVAAACQKSYVDRKDFGKGAYNTQYNLEGRGTDKFLLPGVLDSTSLTCVLK